jgi:hypothetical protein
VDRMWRVDPGDNNSRMAAAGKMNKDIAIRGEKLSHWNDYINHCLDMER